MLGAAMQAPLSGLVLALELTHSGFRIMVPMIAATRDRHRRGPYHRRLLELLRPPTPGLAARPGHPAA
jgi:H+/Cl- antiporter ClcA